MSATEDHCAHHSSPTLKTAIHATQHCLIGCAIGEWIGLAIGVTMGFTALQTTITAVVCAYISGFSFATWTLVRSRGLTIGSALRVIWLGELVSIAAMEIAMNLTDYHMGGMFAESLLDPIFWIAYAAALVAGFLAALPVNWWLLSRELKHCH